MTEERCENCKCWKKDSESDGFCKRYPPSSLYNTMTFRVIDVCKTTPKDSWCGEWKAKEGEQ